MKRVILIVGTLYVFLIIQLALDVRRLRREVDAMDDGAKRIDENLTMLREDMEDLQVRINALTDFDGGLSP